jgi:chromosome segregation ATPase
MTTMVASSGTIFATGPRAGRSPRRQEAGAMTMASLEVRVKSLEETQRSLREMPDRMGTLEGRMGTLEGRMGALEGRMDALEGRMDALERRMDAFERRLEVVESQIVELRVEMNSGFSAIREALVETNRHMRVLHEEVLSRIKAIEHG